MTVGAPIKARALLAGTNQRGTIDPAPDLSFAHISPCVDAFKGLPYPYEPGKCTGKEAKACATEADCTAQGTTGVNSENSILSLSIPKMPKPRGARRLAGIRP